MDYIIKRLLAIILIVISLSGCKSDNKDGSGAGELTVEKISNSTIEAEVGEWVNLIDYIKVDGGHPPYLYTTALKDGFDENLRRRLPDEPGLKQYGIYVKDSKGTQAKPVTLTFDVKQASANPDGKVVAFPGAEGGGRYTTGGRGGRVIYVTNLEDDYYSPPQGSLRWALNQDGPRIVMFKVSGVIALKGRLNLMKGDVTIAGESAPGDGICLKDNTLWVRSDNVIIRFMKFRFGDESGEVNDAIWGRYCRNIIIDHCSMSWSTDECASFYANENFTMQWCIMTESLRQSIHDKKSAHGYGGIWGGKNASFHHNLLSCHDSRNPRFDHSNVYTSEYPEAQYRGNVDFRNNVIYNWGGNNSYGGEGGNFNMVNNYYKEGPASAKRKKFIRTHGMIDNYDGTFTNAGHPHLYVSGNIYEGNPNGINDNNWSGVEAYNDGATPVVPLYAELTINGVSGNAHTTTHSAQQAFDVVLRQAGAWPRDIVDSRATGDARTGTATYMTGGTPNDTWPVPSKNGLIDTQSAVGGWPVYLTRDVPVDSDGDGMPDSWESANGLNPSDANDAIAKTLDLNGKYTNVEVYLHSLAANLVGN
ncbi:polysaccharide lyase family 1 protein [Dysgonomonas sp. 511]|uniref:pectate lyase family protein n=1 Tax=Dysgonomonas sp. 511 TaxID=2302930 RepID=UPI0013D0742C|nr:pectate lyase [Dysgonomonas sp. 511]NDV78206.1 pectate lyase [Dysgonomonas sp. 511]